jgi:hypothetical protein
MNNLPKLSKDLFGNAITHSIEYDKKKAQQEAIYKIKVIDNEKYNSLYLKYKKNFLA